MFAVCCCSENDGAKNDAADVTQVSSVAEETGPISPRLDIASEQGTVQTAPALTKEQAPAAAKQDDSMLVPPKAATLQGGASEITIDITETAGDLNLDVGTDLAILRVRDGFFKTWNERNPTQAVGYLDRIISVNGSTSREEMTEKLQKAGNLVAVVRKAQEFKIEIDKKGSTLGLDVVHSGNTSLHIKGLRAGRVEEYNKTCPPELKVVPGDRLISVCGVRDDSQKMLEKIKTNEVVEMVISHTRAI